MKAFVVILKVLLLIATGTAAVFLNFFGAISMLVTGTADEKQLTGIIIYWLIITVVFYIAPTFVAMLKKYIAAAAMNFAGMICVLVLYEMLKGTASELYLWMLLINVISILLAICGNWDKIHEQADAREKKKTAAAPSILGGTTKADDRVKTVKKNSKSNGSKKP